MALFNKPKKMIKGTLATSKIPMSKESLAPGEGQGPEIDINPSDGTQPMWNAPVKNEPMPSFNKPEEYMPKALSNPSVVAPVVKAPAVAPVKEAPLSSMLTHEVYTKLTGKPWSTAKKEGLTDGSAASNLKLKAMLLDKANKAPASKSTVDKPASVKLENKDIADLRKKMTTPLVKKAASATSAVTPKSIAQPKAEVKPVSSMDRTVKSLSDLTKKNIERLPKKYEDIPEPKTTRVIKEKPNGFIANAAKSYARQDKREAEFKAKEDRLDKIAESQGKKRMTNFDKIKIMFDNAISGQ